MRDSFLILTFFVFGIILARLNLVPSFFLHQSLSQYVLWFFMFLAGVSIGCNPGLPQIVKGSRPGIFFLPAATTFGTFAGALCTAVICSIPAIDCLLIGSGFGYYSLSSIFITQFKGPDLGTISLLSNIIRELFAIVFMPLLVTTAGPFAAISAGGCASMDTVLPSVSHYAGSAFILPSLIHGMALDLTVPFWIMLFCSL